MQRILVASSNPKKLTELRALCAELPVEILSPDVLSSELPEVVEDGETFLDNAIKKAVSFAEVAARDLGDDVWALADDSGLCVDALDGAPGVHSARYAAETMAADGSIVPENAGREIIDPANNALLIKQLATTPANQRGAAFHCIIAVAGQGELLFAVEGEVRGQILDHLTGEGGFGYDPLFFHPPSSCSFAQLDATAKSAVSHRGQAVARLANVLRTVLPAPSAARTDA
ncbi:MAG: non-canonical purine NTP pyrophosphatase [Planctomycetes bacterium]|nr:non-canonical purine NTP pyrophosphatase [Planctomycetota bacterium]